MHVHNLHPGVNLLPGANLHRVQICTPLCRVHMPINWVHTHLVLDLIRNLIQDTHFRRNSLCLNVLNEVSVLSRCMCVRGKKGGGGLLRYFDDGVCG